MRKLLYLASILFWSNFLAAQNVIKFNKIYSVVPGIPSTTSSIMVAKDGYVIYGENRDSNDNAYVSLLKIDTTGELLWAKPYRKSGLQYHSTYEWGGGGVAVPWGGYAGTGWITNDSATYSDGALYRFDGKGDTVWTRKYHDSAQIEFTELKVTRDKKYILGGEWIGASYIYTATLMKTDSLGNKLWQKNYNTGTDCVLTGIDTTKDGGFIITLDEDYGIGADNFFVIKTDSLGNIQWERYITDTIAGCSTNAFGITTLKNGEYEFCGCFAYMANYPVDPNIYLCKLTSSGNTIWSKKYVYSSSNIGSFLYMLRELPNGDIITCGGGTDHNSNQWGVIMKVDSNGNKVWLRSYSMQQPAEADNLNDIQPTPDGGYVAAGFTYGSSESVWVVKVDSLGCADSAGCVFTAVKEIKQVDDEIKVYPNPANNKLTIAYSSKGDEQLKFSLYDVLGNIVESISLPIGETTHTKDISGLATGLYVYVIVEDNRVVQRNKLVISR